MQSTLTSNAYNSSDFLNFTVDQPSSESNYSFNLMYSVFDEQENQLKPKDIDRLGTLKAINLEFEYNSVYNNFTYSERELKFHICTVDDID